MYTDLAESTNSLHWFMMNIETIVFNPLHPARRCLTAEALGSVACPFRQSLYNFDVNKDVKRSYEKSDIAQYKYLYAEC